LLPLLDRLADAQELNDRFDDAERTLERSLALRKELNSPAGETTRTMVQLGIMQRSTGKLNESISTLTECRRLAESTLGADALENAGCLTFLGLLYTDVGRYAEAEPVLKRALDIREKKLGLEHPDTAHTMNILGTLYRWLGDYPRAEHFYRVSQDVREKVLGPCDPYFATSVFWLATLYFEMGRLEDALSLHRRALRIREQVLPPDDHATAHSFMGVGLTLVALDRYAEAEPVARRALALFEKTFGPLHPRTLLNLWSLARLYARTGRYAEAEPLVVAGLQRTSITDVPEMRWRFQEAYSNLFRRRNQPSTAIYFGKQAVNTLQSLRANLSALDRDLQKAFVTGEKITVYRGLADLMIEEGRLPEAQQVLAMLKEEEYFDFIRRDSRQDPRSTQTALTGQEEAWEKRYREVSGRLAALGAEQEELRKRARAGLSDAEKARRSEIDADLRVARLAFDQLLGTIVKEAEASGAARAREVGEKGLSNLRALQGTLGSLGHGVVTLHYLMGEERLRILLTTPSVQIARESKIGAKDLNRKIGQFRRVLQNPRSNALPVAQELYALLVGPVEEDLRQAKAQTLMISLDGALRYLPLAALHDGKSYLAETYSVALFTEAAKDKLKDSPQSSWRLAGLGLTRQVEGFTALPAVRKELEGIIRVGEKGVLPGEVHFDQEFTAASLRDALDMAYPVLHVASHFVFEPGTESNSFLLLGDGKRMTLRQMKENDLDFRNVDLITLSACDTAVGGGRDANGQEIEGFGALAQKQGARGVIATLWPVADESTGLLMQNFYRMRESGRLTKAEALRQAQLVMIGARGAKGAASEAAPQFSHPYFWAPFILMGNWL
jgi:CHAT domain-containing protein